MDDQRKSKRVQDQEQRSSKKFRASRKFDATLYKSSDDEDEPVNPAEEKDSDYDEQ